MVVVPRSTSSRLIAACSSRWAISRAVGLTDREVVVTITIEVSCASHAQSSCRPDMTSEGISRFHGTPARIEDVDPDAGLPTTLQGRGVFPMTPLGGQDQECPAIPASQDRDAGPHPWAEPGTADLGDPGSVHTGEHHASHSEVAHQNIGDAILVDVGRHRHVMAE